MSPDTPVQKVFPNQWNIFLLHLDEILYLPKESGEITEECKVSSIMFVLLQTNTDKSKILRKSDFVTSFIYKPLVLFKELLPAEEREEKFLLFNLI